MDLWCPHTHTHTYVCVYISRDIHMHNKYIFILELLYQCQLETAERVLARYLEDSLSLCGSHVFPIYSHLFWESALQQHPETAVVTPFWKHCAFQLLHVEATQFDRFLFGEILTADIQPSDGKDLN